MSGPRPRRTRRLVTTAIYLRGRRVLGACGEIMGARARLFAVFALLWFGSERAAGQTAVVITDRDTTAKSRLTLRRIVSIGSEDTAAMIMRIPEEVVRDRQGRIIVV